MIELGVDPFIDEEKIIGKLEDNDYIINNTGKGKLFPTGPECTYNGKTIPCMSRWGKNGSMTGEILKEVVETLDTYNLFDRTGGKRPFFLLDGHNSRLSETFVQYISDIEHEWCVCFGVPYGTSLWQVGDSKQQNGSYKMGMTKYKDIIVKRKLTEFFTKPQFEATDIIPAINLAWNDSFARQQSNNSAISERGWFPQNKNLLLNEQIRATMNDEDRELEKQYLEISPFSINIIREEQNLPESKDPSVQPSSFPPEDMQVNFSCGEAARCLDSLVAFQDLQSARERINKNRDKGKMRQELVDGAKRLSAGNLFLAGVCEVGKEVQERMRNNAEKAQRAAQEAYEKARATYLKIFSTANSIR